MKSALITGANRGIGLETARQLGKLGYHVILSGRDEAKVKAVSDQLATEGLKVSYVGLDVESEASVKAAAAAVEKMCNGSLDALINNAGYNSDCGSVIVNLEDMRKTYEINVIGTIRVTNHFLEMVKKAPAGRIVNVGSIMGSLSIHCANIDSTAYNCSKAALGMYTQDLARALADTNVKVNVGHPGWVQTDMGGKDAPLGVSEGAETSVYLATLPGDGPTGGFFYKKDSLTW